MKEYKIIDISQWMDDYSFSGEQKYKKSGPFNRISGSNPEFVYDFSLFSQSGTHIQGPHYFLEYGRKINDFPLTAFEGEAFMIDIKKKGEDTSREEFAVKLDGLKTGSKIILLRTGNMEEIIRAGTADPSARPGISMQAAEYLAETAKVKMIAIDSPGIESRETLNYEVSKYLCSKEILLLEGLVNLSAVSKKQVFLEAYPMKIRGVEGTPCRALIKEEI